MIEHLFHRKIQLYIIVASLISFLLIMLDVIFDGALTQLDKVVNQWFLENQSEALHTIFFSITKLGNLSTMLILSLVVTLFFLWRGYRAEIKLYWIGMLSSALLFSGIKELIGRTRPSSYIGDYFQHGYSFPSGHATMSMAFALLIFFTLYPRSSTIYKYILLAFVVLFPLSISLSRLYLGVHYLSDVLGGLSLTIGSLFLVYRLLNKEEQSS
ncbi:Membrane-associated phospholipid phosphatase [hydrothermal vent metagenome]|uniref:Membrane-associated phospholipid phosphatase n=1 Tax=hydrothermal vent metagenome TaxID=652676 RepID=A0A1W1CC50_9ZZZZ